MIIGKWHSSGSRAAGIAIAMMIAGCASTPPPTDKLAVAHAAIERAENARAAEHASVELKTARDHYAEAERVADKGDDRRAGMLAEKAESDAMVAEATARATILTRMARESDDTLRALRKETTRSSEATRLQTTPTPMPAQPAQPQSMPSPTL